MTADWRRGHAARFELAVWRGGILCALVLGRPSPRATHMSLHDLEDNPAPDYPLRRKVAAVVVTALDVYATALGKHDLRLVDPLPALIPFYCSPDMGFELVTPHGEAPCSRRSIRP
ncbi:hypothetical protein CCS01_23040 [Rhodopila globiformis]|uniref:N-acetyltransferase domain-containing protein n=2 Tax=Rhodopila globiformis TaxID=1071 RepID=A0A2S6N2M6_RHOGL|nr:hypothetical protein CCS01_23040 [Rhodopila globiformis]